MKKEVWQEIYSLAIQGYPAKKICKFLRRDKAQVSRMISALEMAGFLVCINPGDKVKFYEATKKPLTPDDTNALSTILQEKPCKTGYGGYQTRVHGISFKANILQWKKGIRWDYTWSTNNTNHYLLRKDDITFIRHKGKNKDTLVLVIPDILWNVRTKGSVTKEIRHKARIIMGNFASHYGIRLNGFVECPGTSYAIPVRNVELVKMAQKKTVYFENGTILDASHGFPEFEAPLNMMQELLSLPNRVSQLEQNFEKLESTLSRISQQMDRIEKLFSQPKLPDEKRDVT